MVGAPRNRFSQPYRVSVAIILLCGILSAVLVYHEGRRTEDERTEMEFNRRATLRHTLTREVLGRYTESLLGLSVVFTLEHEITPNEFAHASMHLQEHLRGALAFEWVPYVTAERRPAVEAAMQRQYAPRHFEFIEFPTTTRPKRAPNRPYHYPICYIEPMRGNEIALGYDLVTAPTISFLEKARESRELVVTHQFRLIQEKEPQLAVIMVVPIFRPRVPTPRTDSPETESFAGFLQCVFHVHHLFETLAAAQADTVLDMLFVDTSETDPIRRVLYYRPASERTPAAPPPTEADFRGSRHMVQELALTTGQREWRVLYRPRADWVEAQRTSAPAFRATTLLALSSMLAGLVVVVGRRTTTIHRLVEERTAELAESRRQYANLLHALPGVAFRGRYHESFEVIFASDGALPLTGWAATEFMSGNVRVRQLIHPDDLERVRTQTRALLDAHKDIELEFRIKTRDGEEKWVLSRCRGVYDGKGKPDVLEGLLIDITAAKQAESARLAIERKLLETQKLESLGLLAGGIAHDFNNILSAILGNASLARMTLESNSAADPQLRAIETASLRAAELCRQMLAYAGKGRFVVERVELSALVSDLLPLLRVSIAQTAALQLELASELPGVKADATQLRQIVMNLVLNAVDALAGHEGAITIRTGVTKVDAAMLARSITGGGLPRGDYVFLEVKDTGCGMSPEVLKKIFDPFFTTKFAGRGLGLAAVLGIVRGHNGALVVESEVDRGSTFRLFLPPMVGEITRLEVAAAKAAEAWRQTGDVLVIEDEEPVRVVMVDLLKSFGFNAHAVPDGRSGVIAFRENASRWTLVVIDLLMPGMSGEETLGALRAIKPDVRALLVSGYAEGEIMSRVSGAGRIGFLPKPFRRDAFEEKLKELFA